MSMDQHSGVLFTDSLAQRLYPELPEAAEAALQRASLSYHDETAAEQCLAHARSLAPNHRGVLIANYRYHFYKHHFRPAADFARQCVESVAAELGIPANVLSVQASHADFASSDPDVRFWMIAAQAYGYMLLRLGDQENAVRILEKLKALDVRDQTKTSGLLDVIQNPEDDDE